MRFSAVSPFFPLLVEPSLPGFFFRFNDGAANWRPLFSAIATPTNTAPWIVVLNVDSGPGGSRAPGNSDVNYINGTAQLNAFGHVTSVGYVHLLNGNASVASVEANLTAWASWSTFTAENISVQGIFFDEAIEASGISDGSNFDYLSGLITLHATRSRPSPSPSSATSVPSRPTRHGGEWKPANEATLQSFIDTLKSSDVGWSYFCTEGYADGLTLPPANLSNVAAFNGVSGRLVMERRGIPWHSKVEKRRTISDASHNLAMLG
ncbi:Spherulation-specific family 4-domain-containing protein [Mycena leptocephala]|nr:Spherulation-specific family 4-domain-containing protein [Mycena leptocephala]